MLGLGEWQDASMVVLSCPGPLRRHAAAILPVRRLVLPQVLLGSESQLLCMAAHVADRSGGQDRLVFAPFPEMFADAGRLGQALRAPADAAVHLRFGSVRAARVLKGVRNAAVLAERAGPPPLTASHHPFASGTVLPAAMQRVLALHPQAVRPTAIGGAALPVTLLDGLALDADLVAWRRAGLPADAAGLEAVSLANFRSDAWAAGGVRSAPPGESPHGAVLLPWNMDHPGSIVPELLARLASLHAPGAPIPRIVLLPFNYIGQTGIIRDLVRRVADASARPGAMLDAVLIARLAGLGGLPHLLRLARTAWVDGNDPEHWWTLARLAACDVTSVLIDPGTPAGPGTHVAARVAADEALWVEAETRCGALAFQSRIPSLRMLPELLRLTTPPPPARRRRRSATAADAVQ